MIYDVNQTPIFVAHLALAFLYSDRRRQLKSVVIGENQILAFRVPDRKLMDINPLRICNEIIGGWHARVTKRQRRDGDGGRTRRKEEVNTNNNINKQT